jgi:hypothetical protein
MNAMIVAERQVATKITQKSIAVLLSIAGLKKYKPLLQMWSACQESPF